jgi:hypothetical protein
MIPDMIFEDLSERIAIARTYLLIGNRTEAHEIFIQARVDYLHYLYTLKEFFGVIVLNKSIIALEFMLITDIALLLRQDIK